MVCVRTPPDAPISHQSSPSARFRRESRSVLSPPRKLKWASQGTRGSGCHRGSPSLSWASTARLSQAAGYHLAGSRLGYHSLYSALSRPSRSGMSPL